MRLLVRYYIYILIREGKTLYPLLSKLRARRSVRFGIVKVYVEKECRICGCYSFVLMSLLSTMWRAKKFDKSQGRYELFFTMCIYDEKKQYRVTKK
jgi:hypothetical protein